VDRQGPALVGRAVERFDRLLRLAVVGHFHEAEPARASGFLVRDYLGALDLAELLEERVQVVLGAIPDQVADVNILRHRKTFLRPRPPANGLLGPRLTGPWGLTEIRRNPDPPFPRTADQLCWCRPARHPACYGTVAPLLIFDAAAPPFRRAV